jgi:hypothetical protein
MAAGAAVAAASANCAGVDGGAGAAGPHIPRHGTQPRQIAERASESAPRLAITESLAVRILRASSLIPLPAAMGAARP